MPFRVQRAADHLGGVAVGGVVHALALLVLDDLLLGFERVGRHRTDHVAEAIRVDPQDLLEGVLRHDLVVDRPVAPRPAVALPAPGGDVPPVRALGHVLGVVEGHVLEEVREARPPRLLPPRADMHDRRDRHDGVGRVALQDDLQAVLEREGLVGEDVIGRGLGRHRVARPLRFVRRARRDQRQRRRAQDQSPSHRHVPPSRGSLASRAPEREAAPARRVRVEAAPAVRQSGFGQGGPGRRGRT